jgi:hypothetical protein
MLSVTRVLILLLAWLGPRITMFACSRCETNAVNTLCFSFLLPSGMNDVEWGWGLPQLKRNLSKTERHSRDMSAVTRMFATYTYSTHLQSPKVVRKS